MKSKTPIDEHLSKLPADQRAELQSFFTRNYLVCDARRRRSHQLWRAHVQTEWEGRDLHVCQKGLLQPALDESLACQSYGE